MKIKEKAKGLDLWLRLENKANFEDFQKIVAKESLKNS
jgi:hypothetical protein